MRGVLITGCAGLIGVPLARALEGKGHAVRRFDLRGRADEDRGDVRNEASVRHAVEGCAGVIHLAAVSRVVWGERDPEGCWETNVHGTRNVLQAARSASSRPWVMFASSREVYGRPRQLPVSEDAPLQPINIYGRSKAEGERLMALEGQVRTAIVRLSNVYGHVKDHSDRVAPAFARAAAEGAPMHICGREHAFDFTHVQDVVRGLMRLVEALDGGLASALPLHLVSGSRTTLGELAELANAAGGGRSRLIDARERDYDVAQFVGDPSRAFELLQWRAEIDLADGVQRLVRDFAELAASPRQAASPESAARANNTSRRGIRPLDASAGAVLPGNSPA